MNVLIVHAHPEPNSFNGALTRRAVEVLKGQGHAVQISDLYAMKFDPVSDRRNFTTVKNPESFKQQFEELHAAENSGFVPELKAEMDKLAWCDTLILQFPLWWFGMPAIMKGWVDRVFAMGFAYGGGKWYDRGVFSGKRAICSVTTGGGEGMYAPDGLNGDIHQTLYPIQHGILFFTGFSVLPPFLGYSVSRIGDDGRKAVLDAWAERVRTLATTAPIPFDGLDAYDENFRKKR